MGRLQVEWEGFGGAFGVISERELDVFGSLLGLLGTATRNGL